MAYINKNIYDPATVDEEYFLEHPEEADAFYVGIKKMPDIIIDALFDDNAPNIMRGICQDSQLNAEQSEQLSRLVRQIMSAEVYLGDISQNISEKLQVSREVAKKIASSVIARFFGSALEELKKIHLEKFGRKSSAAEEISAPPAGGTNPNNIIDLKNKKSADPSQLD